MAGKKVRRKTIVDKYGGSNPEEFARIFDEMIYACWEERGIKNGHSLYKEVRKEGGKAAKDTCSKAFNAPHGVMLSTAMKLSCVVDFNLIARQAMAKQLEGIDTSLLAEIDEEHRVMKAQVIELVGQFLRLDRNRQGYVLESIRGLTAGGKSEAHARACSILRVQLETRMEDAGPFDD